MAKRVQSASPKPLEGGRQPEGHWWKTPAVIAAIIAAVATISVALIQRSGSQSKPSNPPSIEQQTHGPNSPAVGHTGGNVTIHQQPSDKQP